MGSNPDNATETVLVAEEAPVTVEIPGYEILRSLGKGGMGMVYLARQVGVLERDVALKTILPKHVDDVFRAYFLREGQRQAKLHHPNILPIFTAGEAGDLLYLSVYYARNGSLRERLEAGSLDQSQTVEIVCDVLSALNHAHSELDVPMAHLDIKPENILFDGDNVFLADFGIAKILAEEGTAMGVVAGDPRYWPPEQQINKATTKSDIYALGIMFFEMLAGERPPSELRSIASTPQAKALARKLPPDARKYGSLIASCLSPNPAARPDAAMLAKALRQLSTPRGISRRVLAWAAVVVLSVIAVSQPVVREEIRDRWVSAFPAATHPVVFTLSPSQGKLWVDGQAEPLRRLSLSEGEHRVVAVAPGYVGESTLLDVADNAATVAIDLEPMPEPRDGELLRFINSFDGTDKSHAMSWHEPTLQNVVELDRLEGTDTQAFAQNVASLASLATAGDAVAATSLFYAAFEGIDVSGRPKALMPGLVVASESGYSLATLLRALFVVQTLLEANETFSSNPHAFEEVQALLRRAAEQGLPETAALVAGVAGISPAQQAP